MRHGGEAPSPPVYIAATGPRVMKVTGEVADGALLMTGIHPGAVAEAREIVADGARTAGRNPDDIETIFTATTIIKDDLKEAREIARPLAVARLMEETYHRWLKAAGHRRWRPGTARRSVGPVPRRATRRGLGEGPGTVPVPARRRPSRHLRLHGPHRYARILRRARQVRREAAGLTPPVPDDRRNLRVRHRGDGSLPRPHLPGHQRQRGLNRIPATARGHPKSVGQHKGCPYVSAFSVFRSGAPASRPHHENVPAFSVLRRGAPLWAPR